MIHAHHRHTLLLLFERRHAYHTYTVPAGQVGDKGEHVFVIAHVERDAHPRHARAQSGQQGATDVRPGDDAHQPSR